MDPANCSNGRLARALLHNLFSHHIVIIIKHLYDMNVHSSSSMHMLPGSHGGGVYKHAAPLEHHIDYSMVDLPKPDDVSDHICVFTSLFVT